MFYWVGNRDCLMAEAGMTKSLTSIMFAGTFNLSPGPDHRKWLPSTNFTVKVQLLPILLYNQLFAVQKLFGVGIIFLDMQYSLHFGRGCLL